MNTKIHFFVLHTFCWFIPLYNKMCIMLYCIISFLWLAMISYAQDNDDDRQRELKARLSPLQYEVTQKCGTERPFSGAYYDFYEEGKYSCVVCGNLLFSSEKKYDSGSG